MQVVDDILETGVVADLRHNLFSSNYKIGISTPEQMMTRIISD
jgi:hypothetical protein